MKTALHYIFLILTLLLVLYLGFSGNDLADIVTALHTIQPIYLLVCFLCWLLYLLIDALLVHCFLRHQGFAIRFWQSLHSAITGIYYSNITPGATGGQPMQMYCLSRYEIPVGVSGSAVAVKFLLFQCALLITGTVLWLTNLQFMGEQIGQLTLFIAVGYFANFFSIGLVLLLIFCPNLVKRGIRLLVQWGVKLRLCKKPEETREKWEKHCDSFLKSVQLLWKKPLDIVWLSLLSVAQIICLMFVAVALAFALSATQASVAQLLGLSILLYISAGYTPLPGASGAQEVGFSTFFQYIFIGAQQFVALVLWRFFTYYASVLLGAIVIIVENIVDIRRKKRKNCIPTE